MKQIITVLQLIARADDIDMNICNLLLLTNHFISVRPPIMTLIPITLLTLLSSPNCLHIFSKISDLRDKKSLLFVRHGLSFHESQTEISMNFNITDGRNKDGEREGESSKISGVDLIAIDLVEFE